MENKPDLSAFDLSGWHALLTGGVRGQGLEIARGLAQAGASVVITGRVADTVESAAEALRAEGFEAVGVAVDMTDDVAINEWFGGYPRDFDILFNNVGMRDRRGTPDLPPEDFARLLDFGITSAYRMTRLVYPSMEKAHKGAVINISSVAGPMARPGDPGYTASKAGIDALTRSHAMEFATMGIRVNAIAPGFFATEANQEWVNDDVVNDYIERRISMQRWGQLNEITGAAIFLASDASSYVTGHTLFVDAGLSARM
ncbi:MAG: SDR family oxidoreductase [Rhodospirillales bacterium]